MASPKRGGGGGSGAQPPKLSPEARDRFMALSDDDFELLSVTLAASDKHSLRQSRFLLQQQLGVLSDVKSVKSAQVAADEACKRLQQAKADYNKKQKMVTEALQAAFQQKEKVAQLQLELDEAVSKAKAALANGAEPKPAAGGADLSGILGNVEKLRTLVGTSSESQGVQLPESLLGPLQALLAGVSALAAPPEPVAAGGCGGGAAPAGRAAAAAGAGDDAAEKPVGKSEDMDLESDPLAFATGDTFKAAAEDFIGTDAEKRKFLEELQTHLQQQHVAAMEAKRRKL